jgi:hypothetical protein
VGKSVKFLLNQLVTNLFIAAIVSKEMLAQEVTKEEEEIEEEIEIEIEEDQICIE